MNDPRMMMVNNVITGIEDAYNSLLRAHPAVDPNERNRHLVRMSRQLFVIGICTSGVATMFGESLFSDPTGLNLKDIIVIFTGFAGVVGILMGIFFGIMIDPGRLLARFILFIIAFGAALAVGLLLSA